MKTNLMNELYIRGIIVLLVIFLVPLSITQKRKNEKTISYYFMPLVDLLLYYRVSSKK